jgi:hypothetical protein
MQVARHVFLLFLSIALPLAVQLWHRQYLTPEARDRAWNTASWAAALYAFGPFSMMGWVWVTTKRWWGIPLGLVCSVVLAGAIAGIDAFAGWVLGLPPQR